MWRLLFVVLFSMAGCGSDSESGGGKDGGTGGAPGDASTDGSAGEASIGTPCKWPSGAECASDEYCADPSGSCAMTSSPDGGNHAAPYDGVCTQRPATCPTECSFACGYDGVGYCNACLGRKAGTEALGMCPVCPELGQVCSDDTDCAQGLKCCAFVCPYPTGCGDAAVPAKCEVPTPSGTCYIPG